MKTTKSEKKETLKDEAKETPVEQQQEEQTGSEAPISEEFQQGLMSHLKGANKHELAFARNHISDLEDAARRQDQEENPVSMTDYPH